MTTTNDALSVHGLLRLQAQQRAEAVAIAAPGRRPLTYGRLLGHVDEVVRTLRGMGIGRNDRVALALPEGPEMAVAFLGVAAGATCVPLNPAWPAAEYAAHLADLAARALLIPAGQETPARTVALAQGIALIELAPVPGGQAGLFTLHGAAGARPATPGSARSSDVALLLQTSGTTARPKRVPLTHANLAASAQRIAASLGLGAEDRCLDVMPLFHIHGLMVLLASLAAGGSVACPPRFDVARFGAWLEELRPTWYSAVPTMHRAIVTLGGLTPSPAARAPLRLVRSSSAPLPPRLGIEIEVLFGAPVIEAYGMTEASHQIASNPLPPRPRKPGSVGIAAGAEVAVLDGEGRPVPTGTQGEIAIRGPGVTAGYENEPATHAFTNGWLRTGDLGHLDPDGYLFITGRLKELINRGGEKIAPREVEDVLGTHPAVAEAVVFPIPHPTLGEDVGAAVVLRTGSQAAEQDLRRFVAERLANFKVPGRMLLVDRIPTGATGKPQRTRLAEQLGLQAGARLHTAAASGPPRTPTESALAEIWAAVLGLEAVGIQDDFFALGGDSIHAMLIASRVRDALGVELPLSSIFQTPTVAGLAGSLAFARERRQASGAPLVRADSGHRVRRASFGQERFWLLDQLVPDRALYNVPMHFRLEGPLDETAIERSLQEIVSRHETLRTTFTAAEGDLLQVVAPSLDLALPLSDLRRLAPAEREAEARRLLAEENRRPFDLGAGPPVRARLLSLGREEHWLLLTLHHIVCDGWAREVLARELGTLYGAFATDQPSPLPELPIQYADFAEWQRAALTGAVLEARLARWKQELGDTLPEIPLPTDRPRLPMPSFRRARETITLSRALSQALHSLSRQEGASLFMTLVAAFQTLLHRYTGEDQIVIGSSVAGRNRVELENLIGVFADFLILRTDLSGDPEFLELLRRARHVALRAYADQDLPFQRLVEALQPDQDPRRRAALRVSLDMENFPEADLTLPGLAVSRLATPEVGSTLDLSLTAREDEAGIHLSLAYSTDLFDPGTASRMLGHLQTLLEGAAADPRRRLSALPLLRPAERQQLLVEWNDTRTEFPAGACVHHLVEAQVERTPDAVAVVHDGVEISYRELNRRANRLAHHLGALGVGPDVLVGICAQRSVEMIVGLLGILKAGGAYLPLDPSYPADRLSFMLEDARPRLVLTQERLLARMPSDTVPMLCLDRDRPRFDAEDGATPSVACQADQLAYVIYTSGSTGRPKGTLLAHRGVVNCLAFVARAYDLVAADVALWLTSISFDASVRCIFGPLATGGRLVLLTDEEVSDPAAVLAHIHEQQITVILAIVPPMLRALTRAAEETARPAQSLRFVLPSGEALPTVDCRRAAALLCPAARIVNQYGPTECTMFSTYHFGTAEDHAREVVPIGRPIANARVYILDRALNPVPVGVPGEIHLGGVGLARGYLNRPELTAEKFIADPFDAASGSRLYKTGDQGRYLPDGAIEFLGRLDYQVKIGGVRVELGEIEVVLAQHPDLREVAVVAREDLPADRRLVAYIVPGRQPAPEPAGLRRFLQERLPFVMVPAQFVMLEALPLTPNGKVNRRALPAPDLTPMERRFVAPRTPLETTLCEIWAGILGREQVGVDDDFFDLGGHSLLALRLLSRVRSRFHVDLPLRALFDAPRVADLATLIVESHAREADPDELAGLLRELGELSDEDARRLLEDRTA
ncbi:MAG: amino acid adenylation domain-containing protein [Candidatus Rokubacteria bacterium]|nr:amino acid adenylation domain-containing protein [Candidatus Rokubacteria bacterium]